MNYCIICLYIYVQIRDATIIEERRELLMIEDRLRLGSTPVLTDDEQVVNTCLMNYKLEELDISLKNPNLFNLSYHYFSYRNEVYHSKVYNIIKDMPKGAVLHVHDMAILGPDYLMNLTYMDNLYICFGKDKRLKLRFANETRNDSCDSWQLLSGVRISTDNRTALDESIRDQFTLVDCDPDHTYPSINQVWEAIMNYFYSVESFLTFRPVWEQYIYDSLKAFRQDKVLYVEIRTALPILYELNGTLHKPIYTARSYEKAIASFIKDYPDFIGAKLIYAPLRHVNNETIDGYLKRARKLKKQMPDLIAGFDLVGQEDSGGSLFGFLDKLATVKDLDFFFHAGETNWNGNEADENLLDAILLGAKRIGHAFSLVKHPTLLNEVLKRDIAIEVNVVSNTVFSLIADIRNHPMSIFMASGVPIVISSDAPGAWEADPISHDFYAAFVGAASRSSDLRLLKTLALNSLKYSALKKSAKCKAIRTFNKEWDKFIKGFDCSKYNPGFVSLMCTMKDEHNQICVEFNDKIGRMLLNSSEGAKMAFSSQ